MQRRLTQSATGLCLFFRSAIIGLAFAFVLGCSSSSTPESSAGYGSAPAAVTGAAVSSAMQNATSWHMTMKGPATEMSMDVVCPDKMRTVSKTGKMTAETVRIGPAMYMKAGRKWMKVSATGQPASVCGNTTASAKIDPNAKLTKGGAETVNGETCTVWTTTVADGKGGQSTTTMCLGSDNLPRQVKTGEMVMTYSDWNKPITIEAPKM